MTDFSFEIGKILSVKDILSIITSKSYDIFTLHTLKKLLTAKTVDGIDHLSGIWTIIKLPHSLLASFFLKSKYWNGYFDTLLGIKMKM